MKRAMRAVAVAVVGVGLVGFAASPAPCAEEFCPMGGAQIKAPVVADKAVDWAKDRGGVVEDEGRDGWTALALSKVDKDIAIRLSQGSVFFGVAGRGGREVDARDAEKVFGRDFKTLREAVRKEMTELWKAGAVKIDGGDVQKVADLAALGVLEEARGKWTLATVDCKGVDLDTSGIR